MRRLTQGQGGTVVSKEGHPQGWGIHTGGGNYRGLVIDAGGGRGVGGGCEGEKLFC